MNVTLTYFHRKMVKKIKTKEIPVHYKFLGNSQPAHQLGCSWYDFANEFLTTVSALRDYEVRQHRTSNLLQAKNFRARKKIYHLREQHCKQLKYDAILLSHCINWCLCCFSFFTNDLPLFPNTLRASSLGPHNPLESMVAVAKII